ncbi:hypothetical protein RM50_12240 [Pseudarthrobacter phenanthrenivorans]|uniref:Uncharacterized protein n=1 Tax=Pseudarthrobacter phenanthrenivorans TaxID=361575 RepID=A0A0B4DID0_PSEPS|nr:hypothetical protein RM50_12240 [Pseudarthrobacter phenanthrenivorans]
MLRSSTGRACFRLMPDSQVFTRGTPPRMEGCRPASRGLALALMTWAQSRNWMLAPDSIVTNKVFRPPFPLNIGGAGRR